MIWYLAQQAMIYLSNALLLLPEADSALVSKISNIPTTIAPLLNAMHVLSYFFPVADLVFYIQTFFILEIALYTLAFTMWIVRIVTAGVIK